MRFARRMQRSAIRRKHLENFRFYGGVRVKKGVSNYLAENCTLEYSKFKYFLSSISFECNASSTFSN